MKKIMERKVNVVNYVNTEKWDDNSVVLTGSILSKAHRYIMLRESKFHKLVTDKNKEILDIGCGSGYFLVYFASKGYQNLYGIEPDAKLAKNIPNNIAIVKNCKAEHIVFPDNTFDVIFIYCTLHHLKGGLIFYAEACDEIYRVLKPGGLLFIMEPGRYRVFKVIEIISKYFGSFSKLFKAFSECLEEEKPELHFFLEHHDYIRTYLTLKNLKVLVDKYSIYTWVFTVQKSKVSVC